MPSFDFITNEEFRNSLEEDFKELVKCFDAESWKAVHVLAGSIIEAVLVDYLLAEDIVSRDNALKMDLGSAISHCKDKKVISVKTGDLSSVIKDYRNLIHPGRAIRLSESVSRNSAEVARALVGMVLEEVEKKKKEKYGYTAEQIVAKIERDSSADAIIPYLLKQTNQIEIERLLLKTLPQQYMRSLDDQYAPSHLFSAVKSCYRIAFAQASIEVKKKVMANYIATLKEESEQVVSMRTNLLRASDLEYLSAEDIELAKHHLFSRIDVGVNADLLIILEGIGKYMNPKEVAELVDPIVRMICYNRNTSLATKARSFLEQEWTAAPDEIDKKVAQRLNDWLKHFHEKPLASNAEKIEQIINAHLEANIPF